MSSEPIIIETPAPPIRERLVLVPPLSITATSGEGELTIRTQSARDATPEDLERAGYVTEAIADNVLDFVAHTFDPGISSPLEAWVRVLREHGAAIARAETAEVLLIQRETELRLAMEDGADAKRERDGARAELARLTAPAEGEPPDEELADLALAAERHVVGARESVIAIARALYRLGVAHERATHARSTNAVYRERDILAALAAKLAQRLNYPAWTAEHDLASDPTWEPEWKDIVFFRLPTGQCSWHLRAGEKAECGLDSLPVAVEAWDGHTTEEKYSRILAFLSSPDERFAAAGVTVATAEDAALFEVVEQPAQDRATDVELVECERADVPATLARLLGEVER